MKQLFHLSANPPECRLDDSVINLLEPPLTLFDDVAQQLAKEIAEPQLLIKKRDRRTQQDYWEIRKAKDANKPTQIRRFYDEVCLWVEKSTTPEELENNLPLIRMLKAKAAYARGREHVDEKFLVFFSTCVSTLTAADDENVKKLKNFKLLFEAFLGFYKLERPKG